MAVRLYYTIMIKEPYRHIGTFDGSEILRQVEKDKEWKYRGSKIATEVLYTVDSKLDDLVNVLVTKHLKPLYGNFNYFYRIHKLEGHSRILPHKDCEENIDCLHVIHFVLLTNPDSIFHIGNKSVHMKVNNIYEINYSYNHSVNNDGNSDRIHIILELRRS